MAPALKTPLAMLAMATTAYAAGSIADINHVVLFMQENRAFDHYFGTMAGVRGFADPNVQMNPDGRNTFQQIVDSSLSNETNTLYPWYLNYLGGSWSQATQCMEAGSNGWSANHAALNNDLNNNWPVGNTPWSIGHFTRAELPAHFAIAEGWTVGDMYQEGVVASTNPNRVTWLSGKINNGSSYYIDNNETPGCEATNLDCYPLTWKTVPEYWQAAGVSWKVFQDTDNFDDNPLAWFKQYQTASSTSGLAVNGMQFTGLENFYEAAAAGTLPMVSIIVGPAELSEHPPYEPRDGAWLQAKVVEAVTSSPAYNSTALIISYDETGGWGDHVTPYHSPNGTTVEWIEDPFESGYVYTGPGFRLPFYIISPWTRGGKVYVEHADHTSQIMFVESWLASKGKNVESNEVSPWRRANMANLTKAFDFAHPDYTLPNIPNITYPSTDSNGNWNGYAVCESTYPTTRPPVPYGNQTANSSLTTEQGFKGVRGQLTEGRFLVFESSGYALSSAKGVLSASAATSKHDTKTQRFVIHSTSTSNVFSVTSAADSSTVGTFTIVDLGNGQGYTFKDSKGQYVSITSAGKVTCGITPTGFQVFSVTYAY